MYVHEQPKNGVPQLRRSSIASMRAFLNDQKCPLANGPLGKGLFWAFLNAQKGPLPNGPLAKGSFLGVPERAHTGRSGTPFGKAFLNGV